MCTLALAIGASLTAAVALPAGAHGVRPFRLYSAT